MTVKVVGIKKVDERKYLRYVTRRAGACHGSAVVWCNVTAAATAAVATTAALGWLRLYTPLLPPSSPHMPPGCRRIILQSIDAATVFTRAAKRENATSPGMWPRDVIPLTGWMMTERTFRPIRYNKPGRQIKRKKEGNDRQNFQTVRLK